MDTSSIRLIWSIMGAALCPFSLAAQVTPAPVVAPQISTDSLASFERPNGSLLRTGTLVYMLTLTKPGGAITPLGSRTVTVSETQLGGTPSWLIADARAGTVAPTSDSVYVVRADMSPERWTATIGQSRLGTSFSRDSAFGAVEGYQGRASFVLGVPANVLLSSGMLERVLELLPLRGGYQAGASLLLVDGASPRVVPAEILVGSPEFVPAGGGAVEAWPVVLRWGAGEERLWVARETMRVVKTEQAVPGGLLTSLLQRP